MAFIRPSDDLRGYRIGLKNVSQQARWRKPRMPELTKNGNFALGTQNWVSGGVYTSTAAVIANEMQVTPTADFGRQIQYIVTKPGVQYSIAVTGRIVSGGASTGKVYFGINRNGLMGDDLVVKQFNLVTAEAFTGVFTATGTKTTMILAARTGFVGGYSAISIKEVPGQ